MGLKYQWEGVLPRYFKMTDGPYAVRHFPEDGWCVCDQPASRKTIISHSWPTVTDALRHAESLHDENLVRSAK